MFRVTPVLAEYAKGLDILDDYDHETLEQKGKTTKPAIIISPAEFLEVVEAMRRSFDSAVFGKAKAAMLLYLVVKNHSFIDGKRIPCLRLLLLFSIGANYEF